MGHSIEFALNNVTPNTGKKARIIQLIIVQWANVHSHFVSTLIWERGGEIECFVEY